MIHPSSTVDSGPSPTQSLKNPSDLNSKPSVVGLGLGMFGASSKPCGLRYELRLVSYDFLGAAGSVHPYSSTLADWEVDACHVKASESLQNLAPNI